MAEVPTLFSGLVGGVLGAVAAVDVPAQGERAPCPAPGTDWKQCCAKLHESAREFDGFVQQLTFIVGKLAMGLRVGVEQLTRSVAEGRAPTSPPLDKADVDQGIDAGKQGAEYLIRGGRLALEATVEGAKVAATRALIAVEHSKEIVVRNIPYTQEKLGQVYASFLRGYHGRGQALGYGAPSYQAPSYPAPSYQQPPPQYGAPEPASSPSSERPSGFFW